MGDRSRGCEEDFNSRSPCGERQLTETQSKIGKVFQLTLPVWGATEMHVGQILFVGISTHAPRVGSDMPAHFGTGNDRDFNSRSPCGERRKYLRKTCARLSFQLTLPVWGATEHRIGIRSGC